MDTRVDIRVDIEWTRRQDRPRDAEEAPAACERPARTRRTPTKLLPPPVELTRRRMSQPLQKASVGLRRSQHTAVSGGLVCVCAAGEALGARRGDLRVAG